MTERTRDDEYQRFQQEYGDADFLEAVARLEWPTTSDVGDAVGCAKSTAAGRLDALADAGELESRTIGGAKVWTVSDSRE